MTYLPTVTTILARPKSLVYTTKMREVELTERETQIGALLVKGKSNQEIADKLGISIHTAKMHIYNLFKKRKVKSRTQFVIQEMKK